MENVEPRTELNKGNTDLCKEGSIKDIPSEYFAENDLGTLFDCMFASLALDCPSNPIDYLIDGLQKLKLKPRSDRQCRDMLNFLSAPPDADASQWIEENFSTLRQRNIRRYAICDDKASRKVGPSRVAANIDHSPRTRLPETLKAVLKKSRAKM